MTIEPDRITAHTQITDYAASGVKELYRQFQKPFIAGLITSLLNQAQDIENAFWALLNSTIYNATGMPLEQIGAIVGEPRGTLLDPQYRTILLASVRARLSTGSADDIMAVALVALGATPYTYTEGNASVLIEPHAPTGFGPQLLQVLRLAKNGGIQLELIDPPDVEANLFTFAPGLLMITGDTSKGYSDTSQVTGGQLTSVLGDDTLPRHDPLDPRNGWSPGY